DTKFRETSELTHHDAITRVREERTEDLERQEEDVMRTLRKNFQSEDVEKVRRILSEGGDTSDALKVVLSGKQSIQANLRGEDREQIIEDEEEEYTALRDNLESLLGDEEKAKSMAKEIIRGGLSSEHLETIQEEADVTQEEMEQIKGIEIDRETSLNTGFFKWRGGEGIDSDQDRDLNIDETQKTLEDYEMLKQFEHIGSVFEKSGMSREQLMSADSEQLERMQEKAESQDMKKIIGGIQNYREANDFTGEFESRGELDEAILRGMASPGGGGLFTSKEMSEDTPMEGSDEEQAYNTTKDAIAAIDETLKALNDTLGSEGEGGNVQEMLKTVNGTMKEVDKTMKQDKWSVF
ncbi:MAG: hypothetical protein ACOC1X_03400, partial [Promethearchaeota archaeon]